MSEKLRVLLVDDEVLLLDDMKALPWDRLNCTIVGSAGNGTQALELLNQIDADVVITDITMPRMNGLDLLSRTKQVRPRTQFVVLTCHDDFNFARSALQLGAVDYLMKMDLSEATIKNSLDKARTALDRERAHHRVVREEEQFNHVRRLAPWLHGASTSAATLNVSDLALATPCIPGCVRISVPAEYEVLVPREVDSLFHEQSGNSSSDTLLVPFSSHDIGVFFPRLVGVKDCVRQMEWFVQTFHEMLVMKFPFVSDSVSVVAYVGPPCPRVDMIPKALTTLSCWMDSAFYLPNHAVQSGSVPPVRPLTKQDASLILSELAVAQAQPEQLAVFLQGRFRQWAQENHFSPLAVKNVMVDWLAKWLGDTDSYANPNYEAILQSPFLPVLIDVLMSVVEQSLPRNFGGRYRSEVKAAIHYITENLSSPLTLGTVSHHVGLSPQYFGQIFKAETGDSFNHFLNRLRVQKASELLRFGMWKVYEVAEQVGIPNYRYFCEVFRKYTGSSPTEVKRPHA